MTAYPVTKAPICCTDCNNQTPVYTYQSPYCSEVLVESDVPLDTILVISEMSLPRQSVAPVLTTKRGKNTKKSSIIQ